MQGNATDLLYIHGPGLNQLKILEFVKIDSELTQARLACQCKLSVAMVNNYMKELSTAGFLEYRRSSTRTVSYHVTPLGNDRIAAMRRRLLLETGDLLEQMKGFIRRFVLQQVSAPLHRVILYGAGNFAELTFHALESEAVRIIAICDDNPTRFGSEWCGREMMNPLQIRYIAPDAVIITDIHRSGEIYRGLSYLIDLGIKLIRLDQETIVPGRSADGSGNSTEAGLSVNGPQKRTVAPVRTCASPAIQLQSDGEGR